MRTPRALFAFLPQQLVRVQKYKLDLHIYCSCLFHHGILRVLFSYYLAKLEEKEVSFLNYPKRSVVTLNCVQSYWLQRKKDFFSQPISRWKPLMNRAGESLEAGFVRCEWNGFPNSPKVVLGFYYSLFFSVFKTTAAAPQMCHLFEPFGGVGVCTRVI